MGHQIINGDALSVVKTLPENSVNTVITSPPYYGLRSYLSSDSPNKYLEVGLEESPERYIERLVEIFREIKRVLRDDGTCWVNLGDTYWGGGGQSRHHGYDDPKYSNGRKIDFLEPQAGKHKSIKPKDMIGVPWMFAFAMRDDGWWLRNDIIWHKSNVLPESVTDRCTKTHEYIFMFAKSDRYYFDNKAIKEIATGYDGRKDTVMKGGVKYEGFNQQTMLSRGHERWDYNSEGIPVRNKRSVWTVATKPTNIGHFASYPEELIIPCVLAGSPEGGTILDPFNGIATTGLAAVNNNRDYIGIELSAEYCKISEERIKNRFYDLKYKEVKTEIQNTFF